MGTKSAPGSKPLRVPRAAWPCTGVCGVWDARERANRQAVRAPAGCLRTGWSRQKLESVIGDLLLLVLADFGHRASCVGEACRQIGTCRRFAHAEGALTGVGARG